MMSCISRFMEKHRCQQQTKLEYHKLEVYPGFRGNSSNTFSFHTLQKTRSTRFLLLPIIGALYLFGWILYVSGNFQTKKPTRKTERWLNVTAQATPELDTHDNSILDVNDQ